MLNDIAVNLIRWQPGLRGLLTRMSDPRILSLTEPIIPNLEPGSNVLDLGAGFCNITKYLREQGHEVTPLDIHDLSLFPDIKPHIYDGRKIPYPDNHFDTTLLITVLHHTPEPMKILEEAMRVSKKQIIIVEDIFSSTWHKYLTWAMDSVVNLEFWGHPHSNKSDEEWREVFKDLGLTLKVAMYRNFWMMFSHATYVLEIN